MSSGGGGGVVPTPDEIFNAQAEGVPKAVIDTIKNILIKRFVKGETTKIPVEEIMEKSNIHKLEEYIGLKLCFERHGWEVNFESDGKVFSFSVPVPSPPSGSTQTLKRFVMK